MATLRTVTGTILRADGTPVVGAVVNFTLSQACTVPGASEVLPSDLTAKTDVNGAFTASLYANNDLTPTGTYYLVLVVGVGFSNTPYTIQVPQTAGPFEISTITTSPPTVGASPNHVSALTVDALVAGKVVFADTAGLVATDATLAFDKTTKILSATGLAATGAISGQSLQISGPIKRLSRKDMPGIAGLAGTLANPPTFTTGIAGAASVIANPKQWFPNLPGVFTWLGARMGFGAAFPDNGGYSPMASNTTNNTDGAFVTPAFWTASFYSDAPQLEIVVKGQGQDYRVRINGSYLTAGGGATVNHASNGSTYRDLIDWTGTATPRAVRRYDIDFGVTSRVYGVGTSITDTIFEAPRPKLRCLIIGDSFTDGTGATSKVSMYASTLAQLTGWEVCVSGWGGTGYVNDFSGARQKFQNRLATDVYPYAPDIVLWVGGINDADLAVGSAATTGAAASACYAAVNAALPNLVAQIVCSNQVAGGVSLFHNYVTGQHDGWLAVRDAIKSAALANSCMFVDLLELPDNQSDAAFSTTVNIANIVGATTISLATRPVGGGSGGNGGQYDTLEFGSDAAHNRERRTVTITPAGAGPATYTLLGAGLSFVHPIGEAVTRVGACYETGTGKVGATTGDGNSDLLLSNDGTHPSQAGHDALAFVIFEQIAAQAQTS